MAELNDVSTGVLTMNTAKQALGLAFTIRTLVRGGTRKRKLSKVGYVTAVAYGIESVAVIYENLRELSHRDEVRWFISDVKLNITRALWRLEDKMPFDHFPFIPRPIPLEVAIAMMADTLRPDLTGDEREAHIARTVELISARADELDRNRK